MIKYAPLFYIYGALLHVGFLLTYISFILPYWFARYPRSQSKFLRIGLWEVCFSGYMLPGGASNLYDGCFYIFDPQIAPLWTIIFSDWFRAFQFFHTIALMVHLVLAITYFCFVMKIISHRAPRAVLFSVILYVLLGVCQFIVLVTFGAGVDYQRIRLTPEQSSWLTDLKTADFSWCYGCASLSFLTSLINLPIVSCLVLPRKSRGSNSLLQPNAWNWPDQGQQKQPQNDYGVQQPIHSNPHLHVFSPLPHSDLDHQSKQRLLSSPDPTLISGQSFASTVISGSKRGARQAPSIFDPFAEERETALVSPTPTRSVYSPTVNSSQISARPMLGSGKKYKSPMANNSNSGSKHSLSSLHQQESNAMSAELGLPRDPPATKTTSGAASPPLFTVAKPMKGIKQKRKR